MALATEDALVAVVEVRRVLRPTVGNKLGIVGEQLSGQFDEESFGGLFHCFSGCRDLTAEFSVLLGCCCAHWFLFWFVLRSRGGGNAVRLRLADFVR